MTTPDAVEFLNSFLNYEQITAYQYPGAFSLDRMEKLLTALGNPHRAYPVLHVAGTKGKGSTCAFAASILSAAGLKTGLYTSPHLISFPERIRVDGQPISEQDLAQAVERLRPFAGKDLTFFEVTTACAFLHFQQAGVEAAVIEVGLGGRLDATNLVQPEVAAIMPISLDHMPKLGNTLAQIAREKAGILKRGVPTVIAPQAEEALQIIEETAALRGAELHRVDREVRIESAEISLSGSSATFQTPVRSYAGLRIPLLGRHQLANAAAAIRMMELLSQRRPDLQITEQAVREGIARTEWAGRCQIIPGEPPLLLDGAQNAESARALKAAVGELFPGRKISLVVGASQEKDLEGMARVWGPWADRIFLTQAGAPRAESSGRLREVFIPFHPSVALAGSVEEALQRAVEEAGPGGLVVVTGSLFIVGEALQRVCAGDAAGRGPLRSARTRSGSRHRKGRATGRAPSSHGSGSGTARWPLPGCPIR